MIITTINEYKKYLIKNNNLIKEGCMSYWPGQHYDDSVADYMNSTLMPKIDAVSDQKEKNYVANKELLDCINKCYQDYGGDTDFWNNHFIIITIIATMQKGITISDEIMVVLGNRLDYNITYIDKETFNDNDKEEYLTIMKYIVERLKEVKNGYAPGFLDENDQGRIEIEKQFGKIAPTDQPLGHMTNRTFNEKKELSKEAKTFISNKIKLLMDEGKPQKQAIAIAYSYAKKENLL